MTERERAEVIRLIQQLGDPLPSEAIQRTKNQQTHRGYDTDGYGYQFIVNRLNCVFGNEWGFSWEIIHEEKGTSSGGKPCFDITVKMGIWVDEPDNIRSCVGSHTSRTYGDALKGAITNGFKKTAAFWGAGRHAYEGALDDDNDPWPDFVAQNGGGNKVNDQSECQCQEQPAQKVSEIQPGKGQSASSSRQKDLPASNQANPPAPKQQYPPSAPQDKNQGKGNGHEAGPGNGAGQQNGNTANEDTPPAGNGKEAGLRRRIDAKLKTIFGGDQKKVVGWLGNQGVRDFNALGAGQLEKLLEATEILFHQWKNKN